ncbi:unnamed protein product [Microthlaspi erraticum]|uniref:Uncharacterized protein n=1 Tax=Microthlaspi erraticum TaxID=1685480 RepID=A0A6D2KP95_9BRAS|nr:unnamed protein product [Microthlaspi erraticum]
MGHEEHGGTWHMDAAQLDTQRKKGEAILKTSSTVYSTNRSSSSTRPAKLQLDRAEKSTVKPEKCCFPLDFPLTLNLKPLVYANSIESVNRDLVELDITTEGMETLWVMDSVELGKLDRLVKEMLQTATNRDKGLFHHQCRTTTLRSSWE